MKKLAAPLFVLCVLLSLLTGCGQPASRQGQHSAVDILTGGSFYLRYTSTWVFADGRPVEFVEIGDGPFRLQQYENDGDTILTVTEGNVSKVYLNGEFLQETQLPETDGKALQMRDTSKSGDIALEEEALTYEEYSCVYNGSEFTLRLLFAGESLWGIQYGDEGGYIKILELSGDIPEAYRSLYKSA